MRCMTSIKLFLKGNCPYLQKPIQSIVDKVSLPKLNDSQALECDGLMNENELLKALTSIDNDETPGNDGITGKFLCKILGFSEKNDFVL